MMEKGKYFVGIIVIGIILFVIFSKLPMAYALSQYGSTGEEVKQIQKKLKDWGYYQGNIDGIYGSRYL